jgi:hypothetical protein
VILLSSTIRKMPPKVKVTVSGSSGKSYPPSEPITLNSETPTTIKNEHFEGQLWVYVKESEEAAKSAFFQEREKCTYGIVVKGEIAGLGAQLIIRPFLARCECR